MIYGDGMVGPGLDTDTQAAGWQHALRIWAATEADDTVCMCGEWRCRHDWDVMNTELVGAGRCKSGRRWFWTVSHNHYGPGGTRNVDGYADTEAAAADAIAVALATLGKQVVVSARSVYASDRLKAVNTAKRAERIAAKPPSDDTDTAVIEYLHSLDWRESDAAWIPGEWHRKTYKITRKTAKRVYYVKDGYWNSEGFVDRATLERDGKVDLRYEYVFQDGRTLYAQPPPIPNHRPAPVDLSELKQAMADAHPDRGGDRDSFQAARARYLAAKAVAT
jgi:hypothetical protein